MSFAGLAPEIINGRGAMIGMLAAFGAELRTRHPVLQQVGYHSDVGHRCRTSCMHVLSHHECYQLWRASRATAHIL
jgi:hypothetical protein